MVATTETRDRFRACDLALEQAAIFAEGDEMATGRLNNALHSPWSPTHTTQRPRDEAVERAAEAETFAETVARLTAKGRAVLTADEVERVEEVPRIFRLVTDKGAPFPRRSGPTCPERGFTWSIGGSIPRTDRPDFRRRPSPTCHYGGVRQ